MHKLWKDAKTKLIKIMEENVEYKFFPYHFFMLTLSAIWSPKTASAFKKYIFKIMYFIILCGFITINIEAQIFAYRSLMILDIVICSSLFSSMYKSVRLVQQRNAIESLLEKYANDKPEDKKIEVIHRKFKIEIRYWKDDHTRCITDKVYTFLILFKIIFIGGYFIFIPQQC